MTATGFGFLPKTIFSRNM